jgi:hypothetical protein
MYTTAHISQILTDICTITSIISDTINTRKDGTSIMTPEYTDLGLRLGLMIGSVVL